MIQGKLPFEGGKEVGFCVGFKLFQTRYTSMFCLVEYAPHEKMGFYLKIAFKNGFLFFRIKNGKSHLVIIKH